MRFKLLEKGFEGVELGFSLSYKELKQRNHFGRREKTVRVLACPNKELKPVFPSAMGDVTVSMRFYTVRYDYGTVLDLKSALCDPDNMSYTMGFCCSKIK